MQALKSKPAIFIKYMFNECPFSKFISRLFPFSHADTTLILGVFTVSICFIHHTTHVHYGDVHSIQSANSQTTDKKSHPACAIVWDEINSNSHEICIPRNRNPWSLWTHWMNVNMTSSYYIHIYKSQALENVRHANLRNLIKIVISFGFIFKCLWPRRHDQVNEFVRECIGVEVQSLLKFGSPKSLRCDLCQVFLWCFYQETTPMIPSPWFYAVS